MAAKVRRKEQVKKPKHAHAAIERKVEIDGERSRTGPECELRRPFGSGCATGGRGADA